MIVSRRNIAVTVAGIGLLAALALGTYKALDKSEHLAAATHRKEGGAAISRQEDMNSTSQPTPELETSTRPNESKSGHRDFEADLRDATDMLKFVLAILPAARAGDRDAQYALYSALDYCDERYRAYFERAGRRNTLEDALAWASNKPAMYTEEIQATYDKCHELKEASPETIGTADAWLEKAVKGSHAAAQATEAGKILESIELERLNSNKEGTKLSTSDIDKSRQEAKQLLRSALIRQDAAAMEKMWELQPFLTSDQTDTLRWAWMLAACQSGFDCSNQSRWMEAMCRHDYYCQASESGPELIRRVTGNNYYLIEERAQAVKLQIAKGDLSGFGLD